MNRESITPKDKDHWLQMKSEDLSSTEVSALFGLSPYMTEFELWHRKKTGDIVTLEEHERMKWGNRLEAAIAEGIADDQGWEIKPFKDYMRIPELRLGSSFDFQTSTGAILEIKNVDTLVFRDGWEVDDYGEIDAPNYIEIQVQHQMLIADRTETHIGALVGGNSLKLISREADEEVQGLILKKCAKFWKSIDDNKPPEPDFIKDADFIISLNSKANADSEMESTEDIASLAKKYKQFADAAKEFEKKQKAIKAQILQLIGEHAKCRDEKFTISAGVTKSTEVKAFTKKGFRNFRINWKKPKKEKI